MLATGHQGQIIASSQLSAQKNHMHPDFIVQICLDIPSALVRKLQKALCYSLAN